jgi:hypothetical protein
VEVFVEALAAEDDVKGVAPREVESEQSVDEGKIISHCRPSSPSSLRVDDVQSSKTTAIVFIFRHQPQTGRMAEVSALAC